MSFGPNNTILDPNIDANKNSNNSYNGKLLA